MAEPDYTDEIWKTIAAAPSYAVSNYGRVKRVAGGQGARPMLRKADLEHTGYLRVRLSENGARLRLSVHRLVAFAFLGDPPTPRHQVAHSDNDKTNNRADNLRWATCRENILDKQIHGTQARGETQGSSKLTTSDVLAIRASSDAPKALAKRFAISTAHVYRLRNGLNWRHL